MVLGLSGQIWRLLVVSLLAAVLRWKEPKVAEKRTPGYSINSFNKASCYLSLLWFVFLLSVSLLAGRGGGGKGKIRAGDGEAGRGWRVPPASVLLRGTEWTSSSLSVMSPWWRSSELRRKTSTVCIKRICPQRGGCVDHALSLAGRGGGGGEAVISAAALAPGSPGRSAEIVISTADSKRRRLSAAAISGRRSGPAALGRVCSSFFSLLGWRVSSDLAMAIIVAASPSGLIPGGGSGGRACRSFVNGDVVLDCVFATFYEVLSVRMRDLVVICFFFRVLPVIVHPPPF
jgi:hypothetical protein